MQRGLLDQGSLSDVQVVTAVSPAPSLAARFQAQVLEHRDEIAVADVDTQLTFGELDKRSNQLAAYLRDAGATPDSSVGLFFDRSVDFVVAALAVLKSGAAYLAMDSGTPVDRALAMLNDAGSKFVLTHRSKTRDWSAGPWTIVEIDDEITEASASPIEFEPDPDSLAYVVYTSGSTGRPKGVEITHANLINLIDWHQSAFDVTAADRASQVAGLGFDASTWEIWPHLCAGATVVIADEATRRSPHALRDWLIENKITIAFIPTVVAEQLLHAEWPAETSLRTLLTGADVLHRRPVDGLPFVVVNNYGPSECTVVSTSGVVRPDAELDGPPSIGRPISNSRALILDSNLQPVAMGEAGELCIAGALVGRGYRNLPELTASRFVTITTDAGESLRVYRTGDRARYLPSGELAFLGRLDDQLKIRGYRIEPGEIVAWLDRYPGIEASAVVALPGDAGPVLVAYVVVTCNVKVMAGDVRDFLAARLPDYMVPGQFVRIAELPMTPNGKLDRAALPAPTAENLLTCATVTCAAVTCASPGTASVNSGENVQSQIAGLVAALLNRPSVDENANFFLLGGHSMLAAQLVARVRDIFGVDITLRQLFTAPTVSALATQVSRLKGGAHAPNG